MHPEVADSHHRLAMLLYRLGNYQKALEHHLKALKVYRSLYGDKHELSGRSYYQAANLFRLLEDNQKAIEYDVKARNIYQFLLRTNRKNIANWQGKLDIINENLVESQKNAQLFSRNL